MSGVSIPIGADLGAFKAAVGDLSAEMRKVAGLLTKALAPASESTRKITQETRAMGRAAKQSRGDFMQAAQGITAVGANVAQIAIGVQRFKQMKAGAAKAAASIRALASNPALRKVAIAAAAAGTAIIGTVAAIKVVRAAFRTLRSAGALAFRGIKTVALGAFSAIRGAARGITRLFTGGGMMGGIMRLAGVAGVLVLATSQLRGAFSAATGFEDMQVSMEQFVGDAAKAKALIGELSEFATKTPFETSDILGASSKLLSAGIGGDIAGITRDIAAVAKDGQQLGELADAVAKGFAKGKFQTEELNKFLERGINLMPELEKVTGLTGDALKKAIEAGLGFGTVSAALAGMSREGGQFFGLLERRSRTTTGLISTLKSAWDEVRRAFAQPILDALKPVLDGAIARINAMREAAARVGAQIRDIFLGAFVLIQSGRALDLLRVGFQVAITGALDTLMRGLRSAIAFLSTALPPIFDLATAKLSDPAFWDGIAGLMRGVGKALAAEFYQATFRGDEAAKARSQSSAELAQAAVLINDVAGKGRSIEDVLSKALSDAVAAAAKAGLGPSSRGFRDAVKNWRSLMGEVAAGVAELRRKATIPGPRAGATGEGPGTRLDGAMDSAGVSAGGTGPGSFMLGSSLTRVGGGGLGGMIVSPMVTQQQRGNAILGGIKRSVDKLVEKPGMALEFAT